MHLTSIIMHLRIDSTLGRLHTSLPQMKEHFQGLVGNPAKPFFICLALKTGFS